MKSDWDRHRKAARVVVMERSAGRCEAIGCMHPAKEWAHLFGRGTKVREPYASSPQLTAGLCRLHHVDLDSNRDPELQERLRWLAVNRFATAHEIPANIYGGLTPLGAVRTMERWLDQR